MRPKPHIAALAAYALADLSAAPDRRPVPLAQNESAAPPSPRALDAAAAALTRGHLYADPDWTDLRAAIAEVHGLDPTSILCGAGSMELIGALAFAYLGAGDRALTTEFGYAFLSTAARLAGAAVDRAPERGLTVDPDAILAAVQPATKIVFVANPGNPTGTRIPRADLERLRDGLPAGVMLVVDEAYGEFADAPGERVFDLAGRGDTVVLRTFSKAYALAGMRVGWGVFPAAIGAELRKVLYPGGVSTPAQAAAAAAMRDQAYMRAAVSETASRRDAFAARARALGLEVPESRTNFVLIRFASADAARQADATLRREGVILRGMAGYGLPDALRATIGDAVAMRLVGDILERFLG